VLYDNREDPHQLSNIAAASRDVVERLIEDELKPWLERTSDPFEIPPIDAFIGNEWHGRPPGELMRESKAAAASRKGVINSRNP
jgi:hypothetical protein